MSWYLLESGQPVGPLDRAGMQAMATQGRLTGGTLVCAVGASEWTAASTQQELIEIMAVSGMPPLPSVPPSFDPSGSGQLQGDALPPFSYGTASSLTTATFKSRWGMLVLIGLVWILLAVASAIPSTAIELAAGGTQRRPSMAVPLIGAAINVGMQLLVGGPLFAGLIVAGARAVRGKGAVSDLFLGFRRYGTVVAASAVSTVLTAVSVGIALAPGLIAFLAGIGSSKGMSPLALLGLLLMLAGAVTVMLLLVPRFYFLGALAADPCIPPGGVGAMLSRSWAMTSGKSIGMGGLILTISLAAGLSIYLLCVGLPLLGLPIFVAGFGAIYATAFSGGRE